LNLHVHVLFLEGVFVDRTAQGLQPRFLHQIPPTDADIATVLQNISRRVIRALRRLGSLEACTEDVVPTGYDPVRAADRGLARTMWDDWDQTLAAGTLGEARGARAAAARASGALWRLLGAA
jgi:hypothetical protein